jgi:hypothetical protein
MSHKVKRLSATNPEGVVVAEYPTKEQAEATREVLNNTTPSYLLYFFIVVSGE